jgi:HK97 family phage major capsid protein
MSITFPELDDVKGKLSAKRKELGEIFAEAGDTIDFAKVTRIAGDTKAKQEYVKALNDEMTDLGKEMDRLNGVKAAAEAARESESESENGRGEKGAETERQEAKTFGDYFVESKAGSEHKGREVDIDFELKTLFQTSAGWATDVVRGPRLVADEQRPVQLVDRLPQTTTTQSAIAYMEETTFTNNAAEVAEGGAKPEAALALTERTSTVRKIAVWIPVTDEQLEDVQYARDYLNNRLPFMVRQRLDGQLVAGDGSAPNLRGLLNVSGIQTQAKGVDPTPDAIYKAMTKVETTGQSMPNLVILHPNDWQDIRLLRTADGVYIWGSPSEAGPERIWGLDVAKVQASTENTGIVLDTQFTELAWRKGMTIKTTDSHGEYFISNKQVVLAEVRVAFTVYRPTAVCSVTGI